MVGTIKITLGDSISSATSRVLLLQIQVREALRSIIGIARVTGWCRRTLDINGQKVTVELYSKVGRLFGRLVWEEYNQEEPITIDAPANNPESLSQATLQVVDSYYEVIDKLTATDIAKHW